MQPLWKAVWRFSKKIKIELLYDPELPFLAIYQKKIRKANSKGHMHPYVHRSIVCNSVDLEAA